MGRVKQYADGTLSNLCRVCSCSDREPCDPPCAWFDDSLCTSCALVVEALANWAEGAHWANRAALWREVQSVRARLF